jgi:hypothetical protein
LSSGISQTYEKFDFHGYLQKGGTIDREQNMIWVLFLIFFETGHEALAKFDSADDCKAKMAELEEAYKAQQSPNTFSILMFGYDCIPVPDKFEADK